MPVSSASLPKVENLTVSDITPYGFRLSWAARDGDRSAGKRFSHFQVEVSDSGRLLESQEFLVPGNQTSLDIWGLITGIGYEVRLTGVSASGLRSRPLTAVAVTGITIYLKPAEHTPHINTAWASPLQLVWGNSKIQCNYP